MEGHEIFKQARIDHGYSLNRFSEISGVKVRSLTYYENGQRSFDPLMVDKVLSLFNPLNIDPEAFFEDTSKYKETCDDRMRAWEAAHPRVLDFSTLRHVTYDRIMHLKISEEQHDRLNYYYQNTFQHLSVILDGRKELTVEEYKAEYLDFMYHAKCVLYDSPDSDTALGIIREKYFRSEYSSNSFGLLTKEFSDLIGYSTTWKLRNILSGDLPLEKLPIIVALRLCYVIGADFNMVFKGK